MGGKDRDSKFEALWKEYDTNSDGKLDKKECAPLAMDIMGAVENSIEESKDSAKKENAPKEVIELFEETIKGVKKRKEEIKKHQDEACAELLETMDADGDGKVTKEEFVKRVPKVLQMEASNATQAILQMAMSHALRGM